MKANFYGLGRAMAEAGCKASETRKTAEILAKKYKDIQSDVAQDVAEEGWTEYKIHND